MFVVSCALVLIGQVSPWLLYCTEYKPGDEYHDFNLFGSVPFNGFSTSKGNRAQKNSNMIATTMLISPK